MESDAQLEAFVEQWKSAAVNGFADVLALTERRIRGAWASGPEAVQQAMSEAMFEGYANAEALAAKARGE